MHLSRDGYGAIIQVLLTWSKFYIILKFLFWVQSWVRRRVKHLTWLVFWDTLQLELKEAFTCPVNLIVVHKMISFGSRLILHTSAWLYDWPALLFPESFMQHARIMLASKQFVLSYFSPNDITTKNWNYDYFYKKPVS